LRLLAPDLDLDRFFPSFTVASGRDLALACAWTLVVLVTAFRPRVGPWLALVPLGFGMLTSGTPILDPFSASLRTLESWNDRRRGFSETDRESDFELSVPLESPTWDVAAGATLYSPRFSLPAGQWDLRVESNADAEAGVLNVARISLVRGDESRGAIAAGLIETGERVTTIPVDLTEAERRVHVKVEGVQSRVRIRTVRLTPRSLEK